MYMRRKAQAAVWRVTGISITSLIHFIKSLANKLAWILRRAATALLLAQMWVGCWFLIWSTKLYKTLYTFKILWMLGSRNHSTWSETWQLSGILFAIAKKNCCKVFFAIIQGIMSMSLSGRGPCTARVIALPQWIIDTYIYCLKIDLHSSGLIGRDLNGREILS